MPKPFNPEIYAARGRLARASRAGTDPRELEEARRNFKAVRLEAEIRETVDSAPPLSAAQREKLAAILAPAR